MPEPQNGRRPGATPADHHHHLTAATAIDRQSSRWARHAWWHCVVRSFDRPALTRCPMCCRCEEWYCSCPEHALVVAA